MRILNPYVFSHWAYKLEALKVVSRPEKLKERNGVRERERERQGERKLIRA